tara:strand:+ start:720 stop:1685 length:966 start_codon:yes stop_codon:yes gene_type:complete
MKYCETKFEEYIQSVKVQTLHPELNKLNNNIDKLCKIGTNNLILYGPTGVGKYSQSLDIIKKFSQSGLKYERKINIETLKNKLYNIRISDIHFEIDMELLGCNAKLLWNDIFKAIIDILSTRQEHSGIILCKNFHKIHNELLDIFYSYMQTLSHKNISISYILLTESISFIPNSIINKCAVIPVKLANKTLYRKCFKKVPNNVQLSNIHNIKNLISKNNVNDTINQGIINNIVNGIETKEILSVEFRNELYNIFIYHLDLYEYMLKIIKHFIDTGKLDSVGLSKITAFIYKFLKFYNNNYRPIYHLERFILYLTNIVHATQ